MEKRIELVSRDIL